MTINAQPISEIMARSPIVYNVELPEIVLTNAEIYADIYLWRGNKTAIPGTPTYTIRKYPNEYNGAIYDISPIVKAELNATLISDLDQSTNDNTLDAIWVQCKFYYEADEGIGTPTSTNTSCATLGWYDYPNGINQNYTPYLLAGTTRLQVTTNQKILIPVWVEKALTITLTDDNTIPNTHEIDVTAKLETVSEQRLTYINAGADFWDSYALSPTNTLTAEIKGTGDVLLHTFIFDIICEPKYTPQTIYYLDKYGQWAWLNFSKKSIYMQRVMSNQYENAMLWPYTQSTGYYDASHGQTRSMNKNGTRQLTLNTDFLSESDSQRIQELMLSERCVLHTLTSNKALILTSQSQAQKTGVNDSLMSYTLTFDEAYMTINQSAI